MPKNSISTLERRSSDSKRRTASRRNTCWVVNGHQPFPIDHTLILLSALLVFATAGCSLIPGITPQPSVPEEACRFETVGHSVKGRTIKAAVLGKGEDVTMFLGCTHGNEPCGEFLLSKLTEHLEKHPELLLDRKVVILPAVNPDGLAKGTRYNANGVDINRNFPSRNWRGGLSKRRHYSGGAKASEPETKAVVKLIQLYRPDKIVAVHSSLNCVDYDGPALDMATAMARLNGYRVKRLGARRGSLGAYAGEDLGIPVVTIEINRRYPRGSIPSSVWWKHKEALLHAIRYDVEQIGK